MVFAMAFAGGVAAGAPRPPAPPAAPEPPATLPTPVAIPTPTATPLPPQSHEPNPNVERAPDFVRDVQPILARACNPCHFPGGKMYPSMPFDDPNTLASHQEGVLRRLKGSDRETAQLWLSALP
jgi:hypothetical protein